MNLIRRGTTPLSSYRSGGMERGLKFCETFGRCIGTRTFVLRKHDLFTS